jgi:coenzyme Q-binding protein COQ10
VVIEADLVISFKVFRERFGSRVVLRPAEKRIDVAYLDGPFRYLNNHWHFTDRGEAGCEVDFFVDFEFRSRTLQAIIGVVFNEAMQRIVRAFETRAAELYSTGNGKTGA